MPAVSGPKFLSGRALQEAIHEIVRGKNAKCAVAFWGKGAETSLIPIKKRGLRIICNLVSGGTNPSVIKKLKNCRRRQHDTLHAKVYLSNKGAIVTSANASTNGLGFEGFEQEAWIEAGVFVDEKKSIKAIEIWFDQLWNKSRAINPADYKKAELAWKNRKRARPTARSFADYDVDANPLLIAVYGDTKWKAHPTAVKEQLGYYNARVHRQIDEGVDLASPKDEPILKPGTWVLGIEDGVKNRPDIWWIYLDQVVRDAFTYEGHAKPSNVVLASVNPPPVPFKVAEPRFRRAFFAVFGRQKFRPLRADPKAHAAWYAPHRGLIRALWRDVRVQYQRDARSHK